MLLERGARLLAEPLISERLASREAGLPGDSRLVADVRQALAACLIAHIERPRPRLNRFN